MALGSTQLLKPLIDCARLPREAMFVALPLEVDTMLPRFDAGHEHGKQTNEFAAHEQLRAAAARNRYTA
jgi:hypothetical protein